jgi:hypothetical protein
MQRKIGFTYNAEKEYLSVKLEVKIIRSIMGVWGFDLSDFQFNNK